MDPSIIEHVNIHLYIQEAVARFTSPSIDHDVEVSVGPGALLPRPDPHGDLQQLGGLRYEPRVRVAPPSGGGQHRGVGGALV